MLLDLFLPRRCAGCGGTATRALCDRCVEGAARLLLPGWGRTALARDVVAVGLFAYDGVVQSAIHRMKLRGMHAAAPGLGRLLRTALQLPEPSAAVGLTWIPATRARRRARGADLPELLAGPDATPLLVRSSDRPDQTTLRGADRRTSPHGSFRAHGHPPAAVVLIDDVRTTGATALAAALALQAGGARRVLVATLAVAGGATAPRPGRGR